MLILLLALLVRVQPVQPADTQTGVSLQADVDALIRAAENVSDVWLLQPPPQVPQVAVVARNGRAVVPLLVSLLSDDPGVEQDRRRWRVQQQAALALCRIYSESTHCGRTYCDGDLPERIGRVRRGWLRVIASDNEMRALSSRELLDRFQQEPMFTRQFEFGRALAATGDRRAISELATWLAHDDRHRRGNTAWVLARLGDSRGFQTIAAILGDRTPRAQGQGIPVGGWSLPAQIHADRYYAAHLLGDLKDPSGVDLLIPLLNDGEVGSVVPWALAEIGDRRSIEPLILQLDRDDPSVRVLAIGALETLNAREALPRLRALLQDTRRANFGNALPVADVARRAIAVLSQER